MNIVNEIFESIKFKIYPDEDYRKKYLFRSLKRVYSLFGKENRSKKSMAKITAKKASLVANDDHNSDHEILLDHDRNIYPSPKTDDQDLVSEIDLIHSSHINHLSNADVMKMAFCGDTVVKVDD